MRRSKRKLEQEVTALSEMAAAKDALGPRTARTEETTTAETSNRRSGWMSWLRVLGPGFVTGTSDDDPSGIATYSQAGAAYGNTLLWTVLFSYPLMTAIQEVSGRIGRVTGHGLAGVMARHYPRWLLFGIVGLMLAANTLNLGADIGAMGAAMQLLISGPQANESTTVQGMALVYAAALTLLSLLLQIFVPYRKYSKVLKWLGLSLLAYVAAAFAAHLSAAQWRSALWATIMPHLHFSGALLTTIVALLGTTISPYLFFWQASQEVEDATLEKGAGPLKYVPRQGPEQLQRIRLDTYFGMFVSELIAYFIILTTAATLHAHGITDIETTTQAAQALLPLAGKYSFALFSVGIIGTGMLAIPVLAGSAAYGFGEAFRWRVGLNHKWYRAKGFYGVLAAATIIGMLINFAHINSIKALFWSAVLNGVVAGPVMVVMMLIAANRNIMQQFVIPRGLKIMGWLATAAMLAAGAVTVIAWGK